MKKASSSLYKLGLSINKVASKIGDVEHILSGRPDKLIKKRLRKNVYKKTNKAARKINKFFKV